MRKYLLLVSLVAWLPATAQTTDKTPTAEHAAAPAKPQAKKKPVANGQKEETQAKTKAPQEGTSEAQPESKKPEGQAEAADAKTEAGQTDDAQTQTDKDGKLTSVPGSKALGMSILGNQETPTSLVIVPWKSSEVGRATGISPMLDDSRQPVDREVFMRELRYYQIRSENK